MEVAIYLQATEGAQIYKEVKTNERKSIGGVFFLNDNLLQN